MGKRVVACGDLGSGQVAKLCNNLVLAVSMAAVSEGLAFGQRHGLDPALLSSIFNSSSAQCWSSEKYNPAAVSDRPSLDKLHSTYPCFMRRNRNS